MADCCLIWVFKKCKDNHWKKSLLRRAIGMSNMGKGAVYYLTRSKSLLIDTAIVAILAIFMSFAMQMDTLQSKGDDYLVLMLYAVIFGLTSLQSGAMIVDLTAKDKFCLLYTSRCV